MDIYVLTKVACTTDGDEMQLTSNATGAFQYENIAVKTLAVMKQQLMKEFQFGRIKSTTVDYDTATKFTISNARKGKVTTIKIQRLTIE